jgi:hypothetical protein
MCNPSRVLYSGCEQDNRNANLSAAFDEASADEWLFYSRGESDDDESTEFRALFSK